jgi:hypothetical protein
MPPLSPATPPTFLTWPRHGITGVTVLTVRAGYRYYTFQKHCMIWLHFIRNGSAGGSLLLYIPKHQFTLTVLLRNDHSVNIVGWDQEFWMIDAGKQYFKERCIWYNYTLFIWALCQDQRKWTILAAKMHVGTMDRGFTVYMCVCANVCNSILYMYISSSWWQIEILQPHLYWCVCLYFFI